MSNSENITMSDKLFDLCEKQLLSITDEAAASIVKVTERTSQIVSGSAELSELISDSKRNRQKEANLCAKLESSANDVIVNMQFFDELSQRIEHIQEIVNLIKIESGREGFLSDPRDSEDLFKNIKNIFSIRSEFEVMRNIFPEYDEIENSNVAEIF